MASQWYKPKVTEVSFEDFGAPDIKVQVLDVNALPYGQARALSNEWKKIADLGEKASLGDQDTGLKMLLGKLVYSWNLTDPYDDDAALVTPKEDPDVVDKLPIDVLMFIAQKAFGVDTEPVPPTTGSEL